MSINNVINPYNKEDNKQSSENIEHKKELESAVSKADKIIKDKIEDIQKEVFDDPRDTILSPDNIQVNIKLLENVYQVARLICLFEYDMDWNSYVSDLVTRDAFMMKDGDCNIFMNYVQRKLKDEKENS